MDFLRQIRLLLIKLGFLKPSREIAVQKAAALMKTSVALKKNPVDPKKAFAAAMRTKEKIKI